MSSVEHRSLHWRTLWLQARKTSSSGATRIDTNSLFLTWTSLPKQLGNERGLLTSPFVDVTFDISTRKHEFPYAILCEPSDDGCHLGISVSKVVQGCRYRWWLENSRLNVVRKAKSLRDWLDGKIDNPATFEWRWDRVACFGPESIVESRMSGSKMATACRCTSTKAQSTPGFT